MSRHILIPGEDVNNFLLVPTEGKHAVEIDVPDELYPDMDIYEKTDATKMKKLLYRLAKTDISKTPDGFVSHKKRRLDVNFKDCVSKCCNDIFLKCYEDFYCILRKNNITF